MPHGSAAGTTLTMDNSARQLANLSSVEGFFVKDWRTGEHLDSTSISVCEQYAHSLSDLKSNENIHNRACHNLWIYNSEIKRCREALQAGNLESFVAGRLENTRYKPALDLVKKR